MQPIETEGKTVKEAIDAAVKESGLRRDQVEITVLQEGSAGFMGLGAKPARVRLTEKRWGPDSPVPAPAAPARTPSRAPSRPAPSSRPAPAPRHAPRPAPERAPRPAPEPRSAPRREEREAAKPITPAESAKACEQAQALVLEVLKLMGIAAPTAAATWDADLERVKITVESQDAPILVGRDGRVLESLQFLATLMLARGSGSPIAIQVDALSYWEKRERAVLDEARRAADAVKANGKPVRMEPMDSSMRRLVHRTLASDPDVTTVSEGEGPWRKLVIRSRKG